MIDVLITGAGFSTNLGGYLAVKFWELIYNSQELDHHCNIKDALLDNKKSDYESVYEEVIFSSNSYSEEEINSFRKAVEQAYSTQEFRINSKTDQLDKSNEYKFLQKWLDIDGRKIFFTLNQDLLIEKMMYHYYEDCGVEYRKSKTSNTSIRLKWLGMPFRTHFRDNCDFQGKKQWATYLNEQDSKILATIEDDYNIWLNDATINNEKICLYVKLHGCQNLLNNKEEKMPYLISGQNKIENIKNIPVLNAYREKFKDTLYKNQCRIIMIGYGFGDRHVNKVLLKSIKEMQSKVIIVTKGQAFSDFRNAVISIDEDLQALFSSEVLARFISRGVSGCSSEFFDTLITIQIGIYSRAKLIQAMDAAN